MGLYYEDSDCDSFTIPPRHKKKKSYPHSMASTVQDGHKPREVKREVRIKAGCVFVDEDESGVCVWLLESSAECDLGFLSGSLKVRSNSLVETIEDHERYSAYEERILEANKDTIIDTIIDESKEELDLMFGETTKEAKDYIRRNGKFISGIPWEGEGKLSRDKSWRRQHLYVPMTMVLNMTEFLRNNFRGETVMARRAEFMATRCIRHYLYSGDGEVSGVKCYPIDRLPNTIWIDHRNILEKTTCEGKLPTFQQVAGVPRFFGPHGPHGPQDGLEQVYSDRAFLDHLNVLRGTCDFTFFRSYYPTLVGDAATPKEVLERIYERHRHALLKREIEAAKKVRMKPTLGKINLSVC